MYKILLFLFIPFYLFAQDEDSLTVDLEISLEQKMRRNLVDLSIEDYVNLPNDEQVRKLSFYGFLDAGTEKYYGIDGTEVANYKDENWEFKQPRFHLYGVSHLSKTFTVFFNLGHTVSTKNLELTNAWGNIKIKEGLQLRLGKMYRRFDLFNERLDQTAAIIGIDPPEMYDPTQYILPIYSLAMLHGNLPIKKSVFSYALMLNNGESGAEKNVLPLGWDFRLKNDKFLVGTSGYLSNIGTNFSLPSVGFGKDTPEGAIRPWIQSEKYWVTGFYGEALLGNFSIKSGYYFSYHQAFRNPDKVLEVIQNVRLEKDHLKRFVGTANYQKPLAELSSKDIIVATNYWVQTFYVRLAYNIYTPQGQFIPFLFADYIENSETIPDKNYGGSSKMGLADDGAFFRPTVGLMYKPIDNVAFKSELSFYNAEILDKKLSYPELRFQVAYMFK